MSYRFADTVCELYINLYDIYHFCVYSEKLLMMHRENVRNMYSFIPKINFENLAHLVGFIISLGEFRMFIVQCVSFIVYLRTVAVTKLLSICRLSMR